MVPKLRLYNTLTRQKEDFVPFDPGNVRMYVCGPTVYDDAHIGNARPIIVFDLLFRLLRHRYGPDHVTYVRNVTDVDDKINARAAERGISIRELTESTLKRFHDDIAALGVLAPTVEPRATEYIDEMKTLIERLVASGHAYVAEEHVLFSVPSMPDYGALSKRPLDELEAGARVEVAPYKRSPLDFVLWKPSKPGEPAWPSPAGIAAPGRPGWHIECSAMSWKHLGEKFDIHAGGIDLVFPHHENEVAQSRCSFNTEVMARYWLHNGFLQVEGEKMAKSAGNFVTIRELLRGWRGQAWSGAAIRWAMLQTHYRQPIDWTFDALLAARNELWRMFLFARGFDREFTDRGESLLSAVSNEFSPSEGVLQALADDLNTPEALAAIRQNAPRTEDRHQVFQTVRDLMFLGVVSEPTRYLFSTTHVGSNWPAELSLEIGSLGFDLSVARANQDEELANEVFQRARDFGAVIKDQGPGSISIDFPETKGGFTGKRVGDLVAARTAARAAKNWAESDRIRNELKAMGILLHDNKDGTTTWEVAR
jgi:cysteinyl-tRNA synthetase